MKRSALAAVTALGLLMSVPVPAGCISDCRDEYESAVEDCRMQYDDPDDADELRMCIDNARSEYEDCVEECRS